MQNAEKCRNKKQRGNRCEKQTTNDCAAKGSVLLPAVAQPSLPPVGPPQALTPAPAPAVSLRSDQVVLLERTLAQAETHGFEHDAFLPAGLDRLLQSSDPDVRRNGQSVLVAASLRYAQAVHAGRLTPAHMMAILRDHGRTTAPDVHPQDIVGRSICAHAAKKETASLKARRENDAEPPASGKRAVASA